MESLAGEGLRPTERYASLAFRIANFWSVPARPPRNERSRIREDALKKYIYSTSTGRPFCIWAA